MKGLKREFFHAPICRLRQDCKVTSVCQGIFQFIQRIGEDRHLAFRQSQIDQRVSHTQIQKFSLPLDLFGDTVIRLVWVNDDGLIQFLRCCHVFFLKGSIMLNHPTRGRIDPLGKRRNSAHTRSVNINNAFQQLRCQILFANGSCMVKREVLAGCYASGFHHSDFIHTGSQALLD